MIWFWKKKQEQPLFVESYCIVPYCKDEFSEKVWKVRIWTDMGNEWKDCRYLSRCIWLDWETSKQRNLEFKTPEDAENAYLEWKKLKHDQQLHLSQPPIIRIKQ